MNHNVNFKPSDELQRIADKGKNMLHNKLIISTNLITDSDKLEQHQRIRNNDGWS